MKFIAFRLGIEVAGGLMSKIVERNSRIPMKAQQTFTTYHGRVKLVLC